MAALENTSFGVWGRERWLSSDCQRFYAMDQACLGMNASRMGLFSVPRGVRPQTCVREDLAAGGREYSTDVPDYMPALLSATEVIVVDEYKFVYLLNRKVGSMTIRHMIQEIFGVTMAAGSSCPAGTSDVLLRGGAEKRCTTLTLPPHVLEDYFFFTYVRDPVKRFYSAVDQAIRLHWMKLDSENCLEQLIDIAQYTDESSRSPNGLLESQAQALSSPVFHGHLRGMVDLDWIESVNLLPQSMPLLLSKIEAHAGKCIPPHLRKRALEMVADRRNPSAFSVATSCRAPELDEVVRRVYAQDIACGFGGQPVS